MLPSFEELRQIRPHQAASRQDHGERRLENNKDGSQHQSADQHIEPHARAAQHLHGQQQEQVGRDHKPEHFKQEHVSHDQQGEFHQRGRRQFANELARRGLIYLSGIGQHPSNQWPSEESFLVLGINLQAAKKLGEHFDQNAIVWCGVEGLPELIMLR